MSFRKTIILGLTLAVALGILAPGASARVPDAAEQVMSTVDVQILAFNDFHGNLQPPAGSAGRDRPSSPAAPRISPPT